MPRTGGEKTKKKILKVAEDLFAERGFNGTSVDLIAKQTGVNKALIYYHFKDKNDIILSLFSSIIDELYDYGGGSSHEAVSTKQKGDQLAKIRDEVEFCLKRKKILSVLLMESLKSHDRNHFLFQCAEIVINHEVNGNLKESRGRLSTKKQKLLVHEFFTGFIPITMFVVLQDKWSDYFKCNNNNLMNDFLDAFEKSHLASCYAPEQV